MSLTGKNGTFAKRLANADNDPLQWPSVGTASRICRVIYHLSLKYFGKITGDWEGGEISQSLIYNTLKYVVRTGPQRSAKWRHRPLWQVCSMQARLAKHWATVQWLLSRIPGCDLDNLMTHDALTIIKYRTYLFICHLSVIAVFMYLMTFLEWNSITIHDNRPKVVLTFDMRYYTCVVYKVRPFIFTLQQFTSQGEYKWDLGARRMRQWDSRGGGGEFQPLSEAVLFENCFLFDTRVF